MDASRLRADPPRGRYEQACAGNGPCRACGMLLGTNLGKCMTCFDAYADMQLCYYLDHLENNVSLGTFATAAAATLDRHGSMLAP